MRQPGQLVGDPAAGEYEHVIVAEAVEWCAVEQQGDTVVLSPSAQVPTADEAILRNQKAMDVVKDAVERIRGKRTTLGVIWGWQP